MQAKNYENI